MSELPTADQIASLTTLLAPGIIILWTRSRFRDASPPQLSEKVYNYAIVSVAYNAAVYPLFDVSDGIKVPSILWHIAFSVCIPILFGSMLVYIDMKSVFYRIAERLKLRPVHHIPNAWDYTLRGMGPSYAIVHLADGSEIAGAWDNGSFASSTSGDRDVFISRMFKMQENKWIELDPPRSILICGGSIRLIEFIEGGQDE